MITLTAGLSYFVMATGAGWSYYVVRFVHHHKEGAEVIYRQIYWARYVDWAITTPLLLLDLTLFAGLPGAEIILVIFADVVMVLFVRPTWEITNNRACLVPLQGQKRNGDTMSSQ
jgi:bacteriorhodopsin